MRRKIGILLTWIYLFTATELIEVFKFPVFIVHYREHQIESPRISLLEFIDLHYFSGNPRDEDYARDEQLPFRNHQQAVTSLAFSVIPSATVAIPLKRTSTQLYYFNKNQDCKSSHFSSDVWQPPKI